MLGAVVVFRVWRRRSWDQAAQQVLFYAKVVVALVAAMVDARLAAWYALAAWGERAPNTHAHTTQHTQHTHPNAHARAEHWRPGGWWYERTAYQLQPSHYLY